MKFLFLPLITCLSSYFLLVVSTELLASPSKKQLVSLREVSVRDKKDYTPLDVSRSSVEVRTSTPRSCVFFTADNAATLYVNGVFQFKISRWHDFAFKYVKLNPGDVVAIVAQDFGGWWGAVAVINYLGQAQKSHEKKEEILSTGGPGWKAIKGHGPSGWMLPSYSACSWPGAVVRPGARKFNPGKAKYFPYSTDARYVWAEGAGQRDTISMRYTIGEECYARSRIIFTADNSAELFVNGKFIRRIASWGHFTTVSVVLKLGDVVSIVADDYGVWYGAIAAIHYWGRYYVTGRDDFKAVKAFSIPGDNDNSWMLPKYSSCRWPKAVLRPRSGQVFPGKAPGFPYSTGARYVWASGAGVHDKIFIRFVVGGELC